jgi:hypothetical protein
VLLPSSEHLRREMLCPSQDRRNHSTHSIPDHSPTVEYTLTARGSALKPVFIALSQWNQATKEMCPASPRVPGRCSGIDILFTLLKGCHPVVTTTLLCVDYSSSFGNRRPNALEQFRDWVGKEGNADTFLDAFICFARSARSRARLLSWLDRSGELPNPPELFEGTKAAPLISAMRDVMSEIQGTRIVLVADGQFDITIEELKQRIQAQFQLETIVLS